MLGSVNGSVVRAGSQTPVPGATISLVEGPGALPGPPITSGPDGSFHFEGLHAGKWVLRARGPRGAKGELVVPVFDNAVSDAVIEIDGLTRWIGATLSGVRDGAGDIASPAMGDGDAALLRDRGGLMMDEVRNDPDAGGAGPATPRPPGPGSLRGRVVQRGSGMPVGDATISLVSGPGAAPDIAPLTDGAGWFALDGLPPGLWRLRAFGPDNAMGEAEIRMHDYGGADVVIEVGPPEAAPEPDPFGDSASAGQIGILVEFTGDLPAPLPGQVQGHVLWADTGMPVAGAHVRVAQEDGAWMATTADAAGRFRLDCTTHGVMLLQAEGLDGSYGETSILVPPELPGQPRRPTHAVIEITAAAHRPGGIRGQFIRADTGMPVRDAVVSLVGGPVAVTELKAVTDAAGRFALGGLMPGLWVVRACSPDGEVSEAQLRVPMGGRLAEVTLQVERPTAALDLIGPPCRVYVEGEARDEAFHAERVNIEVDRDGRRIRRIWFG